MEKHGDTVASQWAVADNLFETILDNTIKVLYDREIQAKMPKFSVASTISQWERIIDIKEIPHDKKVDDIYINAADGEEYRPPPKDAWGRERRTNNPAILAKKAQR